MAGEITPSFDTSSALYMPPVSTSLPAQTAEVTNPNLPSQFNDGYYGQANDKGNFVGSVEYKPSSPSDILKPAPADARFSATNLGNLQPVQVNASGQAVSASTGILNEGPDSTNSLNANLANSKAGIAAARNGDNYSASFLADTNGTAGAKASYSRSELLNSKVEAGVTNTGGPTLAYSESTTKEYGGIKLDQTSSYTLADGDLKSSSKETVSLKGLPNYSMTAESGSTNTVDKLALNKTGDGYTSGVSYAQTNHMAAGQIGFKGEANHNLQASYGDKGLAAAYSVESGNTKGEIGYKENAVVAGITGKLDDTSISGKFSYNTQTSRAAAELQFQRNISETSSLVASAKLSSNGDTSFFVGGRIAVGKPSKG